MFELCQRSSAHFHAFEAGGLPSLMRKAQNLAWATVQHVADFGGTVGDEVYDSRLAVCKACELCDVTRLRCLHRKCGCRLETKARWRTQTCPLGRWPELPPDSSETNPS